LLTESVETMGFVPEGAGVARVMAGVPSQSCGLSVVGDPEPRFHEGPERYDVEAGIRKGTLNCLNIGAW